MGEGAFAFRVRFLAFGVWRRPETQHQACLELLGKLLARGRTDASNRLEDGNPSPVTGLETRQPSIQVLAVQDGSMLMLGQKDQVLEVVRIFQQTADLNGDLVMNLPNHIVGSWIKWT